MSKQELLSLKEENMKFKENFDKFLKKHECNKKFISKNHFKDFMEEQKTLIDTNNQQIDEIISNDQEHNDLQVQQNSKRKRSENLSQNEITTTRAAKKHRKEEPNNNVKTYLETLIEIPGLQHLAENIFLNLNYKDLVSCLLINQSSKSFLDNPRFWIKKLIQRGLSRQNQSDWMRAIQITKNTDFERNVSFYLKQILKQEKLKDIPCFINESILENSHYLDINYCGDDDDEIIAGRVQGLAPIVNDELVVNSTYCSKKDQKTILKSATIMYRLASKGNLKQIQALMPFLNDPNVPFECDSLDEEAQWRSTPIWIAISMGYLEIIKFLVPFANNLNATTLQYSIDSAKLFNQNDILEYLQTLVMEKNISTIETS